jgi:adenylyltransferase/sulfurtransferase
MSTYAVLGAGGLGCPALLALSAAGARKLVIVDHDTVEASNLQRQVLYARADVGMRKADAAAYRLKLRLPELEVETRAERLAPETVRSLVACLDEDCIVLECTDTPALKFAVNDACLAEGHPAVIAGVVGWQGQAMAVHAGHADAACYRCLFEDAPPRELAPACEAVGVMGSAAGQIGYLAASLAVSMAEGRVESTVGRLIDFHLGTTVVRTLHPRRRRDCPACGGHQEKHDHGNHPHPHPPTQVH